MASFKDLSEYKYLSEAGQPGTKNVGWLKRGCGFMPLAPSQQALDLLWNVCTISVLQTRGFHYCDLCTTSELVKVVRGNREMALGSAEIRVFSRMGQAYAAPNLIYHYVETHHYQPPAEFIEALQLGPAPPSLKYFEELRKRGLGWNVTIGAKAEASEAELDIYRALAIESRAYLPDVARKLAEQGTLHAAKNRHEDAVRVYEESLTIYRGLAEEDPDAHLQGLARTLGDLGRVYDARRELEKATQAYEEALNIYRRLAGTNPDGMLHVALTLSRLEHVYSAAHRSAEAAQAGEEAVKLRRHLAQMDSSEADPL